MENPENRHEPEGPAVRRSKSPLLYLRMLDLRRPGGCKCTFCCEMRDRRYGFPKRYGLRTTVSTRRVDRVDSRRGLY